MIALEQAPSASGELGDSSSRRRQRPRSTLFQRGGRQAVRPSPVDARRAAGRGGHRPPRALPHHKDEDGACSPSSRTLEQFGLLLPALASTNARSRELANLAFVAEATNILLLGPPGVGKMHLAVALGAQDDRAWLWSLFPSAPTSLMEDRQEGPSFEQNLGRRKVASTSLPRSLIVRRVRQAGPTTESCGPRILHAGLSPLRAGEHHPDDRTRASANWGRPPRRPAARSPSAHPGPAAAPQPRAQHPGESYRLREKRQAGLFSSQRPAESSSGGGKQRTTAGDKTTGWMPWWVYATSADGPVNSIPCVDSRRGLWRRTGEACCRTSTSPWTAR